MKKQFILAAALSSSFVLAPMAFAGSNQLNAAEQNAAANARSQIQTQNATTPRNAMEAAKARASAAAKDAADQTAKKTDDLWRNGQNRSVNRNNAAASSRRLGQQES